MVEYHVVYFLAYPGTISLRVSTLLAVVEDIVRSAFGQGFRRILVLNGHGGNAAARVFLDELSNDLPELQVRWYAWWQTETVGKIAEKHNLPLHHANWNEAFPFTRVGELPDEVKPPVERTDRFNAKRVREVLGDGTGEVRIWDAASGKGLAVLEDTDSVFSVMWSPDGSRLASGDSIGEVRIWDAASWEVLTVLKGHTDWVESVVWSPDGNLLTIGNNDGTVTIWDAASGEELAEREGNSSSVHSVAWSPDGSKLTSGGGDETVRIWDAANGEELAVLEGHTYRVVSVAWSPDGSLLVSGSDDGTVRIWGVP